MQLVVRLRGITSPKCQSRKWVTPISGTSKATWLDVHGKRDTHEKGV